MRMDEGGGWWKRLKEDEEGGGIKGENAVRRMEVEEIEGVVD